MKEKEKLVTIARFENGFEAEQAKVLLENEGIRAVVFGGDLVVNLPTIDAIRIDLQAFKEDESRARELLESGFTPAAEETDWQDEEPETEDTDEPHE